MSIRTTCTILALFLSGSASAWAPIATLLQSRVVTPPITAALLSTPDANNPCWQDNYDSEDDCMSTVYSAAFVPEDWITLVQNRVVTPPITAALLSTPDANNPCWQDNYDSEDDCMSTVYSAAFVPEEWIKSMPCGKDADCLPEKLTHPGTMGDAGVEKVDVMEYLNIRKAAPVSEKAAGP